jgi:septum formation protein
MNALKDKLKNFPFRLILGSASPRRQELLRSLGFTFTVEPLNADESIWPSELRAEEIPLFLAEMKASFFPRKLEETELLITSDTLVWCEGKAFNKPSGPDEAAKMLRELSGKSHEVFTAVCLTGVAKTVCFADTSRVYFKDFSDEEIAYYLETCKPYDKAGAYGIQEWLGYIGIEKIEGSFYNIMGLPVKTLYEELMRF